MKEPRNNWTTTGNQKALSPFERNNTFKMIDHNTGVVVGGFMSNGKLVVERELKIVKKHGNREK